MTGAVAVGTAAAAAPVSLTGGATVVEVSTGFGAGDGTGTATFCAGAPEVDRLRTYKYPPTLATAMISAATAIIGTGDFFLRLVRSSQAGIITPSGVAGVGAGGGCRAIGVGVGSGLVTGSGSGVGSAITGVAEFSRCM